MIAVECDPDEFIVKKLEIRGRRIVHQGGRGKVIEIVLKNSHITGFIDDDPDAGRDSRLRHFEPIEDANGVTFLQKKDDPTIRLVQLSPRLEEWLIERAKKNGISLKEYNLPDSGDDLHNISHIERKRDFQSFIVDLIENDEIFQRIKRFVHGESL